MLTVAKEAVTNSKSHGRAREIAELVGYRDSMSSSQSDRWKRKALVHVFVQDGVDHISAYAHNPANGCKPYLALETLSAIFLDEKGGGVRFCARPYSYLGHKTPQEFFAENLVVKATELEMAPLAHGCYQSSTAVDGLTGAPPAGLRNMI